MAKGAHSKIKRRWRALRRKQVDRNCEIPAVNSLSQKLYSTIIGRPYREADKKNAFLHPEDPAAEFPQHRPQEILDLRSNAIPESGLEWAGAYRKLQREKDLAQHDPEPMEEEALRVGRVEQTRRSRHKRSRRIVKF
jgi:hypothetical protein